MLVANDTVQGCAKPHANHARAGRAVEAASVSHDRPAISDRSCVQPGTGTLMTENKWRPAREPPRQSTRCRSSRDWTARAHC
ncbi:hypothetical protein MTO96_011927 [Rhipicephalus appendiculatus]